MPWTRLFCSTFRKGMDTSTGCSHLQRYKEKEGVEAYRSICDHFMARNSSRPECFVLQSLSFTRCVHAWFATPVTSRARRKKAATCYCHHCHRSVPPSTLTIDWNEVLLEVQPDSTPVSSAYTLHVGVPTCASTWSLPDTSSGLNWTRATSTAHPARIMFMIASSTVLAFNTRARPTRSLGWAPSLSHGLLRTRRSPFWELTHGALAFPRTPRLDSGDWSTLATPASWAVLCRYLCHCLSHSPQSSRSWHTRRFLGTTFSLIGICALPVRLSFCIFG